MNKLAYEQWTKPEQSNKKKKLKKRATKKSGNDFNQNQEKKATENKIDGKNMLFWFDATLVYEWSAQDFSFSLFIFTLYSTHTRIAL